MYLCYFDVPNDDVPDLPNDVDPASDKALGRCIHFVLKSYTIYFAIFFYLIKLLMYI